jgi:hypothetical protein
MNRVVIQKAEELDYYLLLIVFQVVLSGFDTIISRIYLLLNLYLMLITGVYESVNNF